MYSNFITPPDFVNEDKHTVTLVDITTSEIDLIYRIAQNSIEDYNLYLYRAEMKNPSWLHKAIDLSQAVIVNMDNYKDLEICKYEKVYYYGDITVLSPASKISSILDYFQMRQTNYK